MPPTKGKGKSKGKSLKNQHQLCDPLLPGEILTDLVKKTWKVGKSIGSGGFGLLYMAEEGNGKSTSVKENAEYVIKIEPQANGPLFCECAFYQRAAKPEQISEWKKSTKLSYVPIPAYITQGRHEQNSKSLRFMVMPRFGTDLHKLWLQSNKHLPRATVAKIAIVMIDALEYVHSKTYVHADIKGANILTGFKDPNKVYLVDFGLACKYTSDDKHYEYKPDPKKAHNGTIEYTSKDAHLGAAPSRRGDIEILGYNLLHWVAGKLPWEDKLTDPNYVRDKKIEGLDNVEELVKSLCPTNTPVEIIKLLQHSVGLKYEEKPNYEKLRTFFKTSLKSMKVGLNTPLKFTNDVKSSSDEIPSKPVKPTRKKSAIAKSKKQSRTTDPSESTSGDSPPAQKPRKEVLKNTTNKRSVRASKKVVYVSESDECSSDENYSESENSIRPSVKKGGNGNSKSGGLQGVRTVKKNGKNIIIPGYTDPRKTTNQRKLGKHSENSSSNDLLENSLSSDDIGHDSSDPLTSENDDFEVKNVKFSKSANRPKNQKSVLKNYEIIPGVGKVERKSKPSSSNLTRKRTLSSDNSISSKKKNTERVQKKEFSKKPEKEFSENLETESNLVNEKPEVQNRRSPRFKKITSRYSMAPLHVEPVLTSNDQLTGEYSGKHPKFLRRRKVNVKKSTISTQTTPSLKRGQKKT